MAVSNETILEVAGIVTENIRTYEHHGQFSIIIDKNDLIEVCRELKENPRTGFDMLMDITAIDWYRPQNRFEVVYFLYSQEHASRIRIKVPVDERDLHLPSVTEVWEGANWYERETFDMYGIRFDGHPDLRRFYMPEDFVDPETGEPLYPMRKDFPVMGIPGALPLPPMPERNAK
ncbi:MAG TPA: NADH-quinone oxidoreductase subunit C [Patescibacteria group bacterium]|nr:NADH-quinone oxidoreductase subunit C [Patescibacteria group bacterium]